MVLAPAHGGHATGGVTFNTAPQTPDRFPGSYSLALVPSWKSGTPDFYSLSPKTVTTTRRLPP